MRHTTIIESNSSLVNGILETIIAQNPTRYSDTQLGGFTLLADLRITTKYLEEILEEYYNIKMREHKIVETTEKLEGDENET